MDRQDKRRARVFALKMAYAYEMTQKKESLIDGNINIDQDLSKESADIISYSRKIVDTCISNMNDIDPLIASKSLISVSRKSESVYISSLAKDSTWDMVIELISSR